MTLTPADVHNVAFSRSRIGKRGYCEQEVDLFIDLVEQELTRHIEEDAELRNRNAELRNRDGGLHKREMEVAERETELAQQQIALRQYESRVRQQEGQLRQLEGEYAQRDAVLSQKETELSHREAQLAQEVSHLGQQEAELVQWENELRQQEAEVAQQEAEVDLRQRQDQEEPVAACVGAETTAHQVLGPYRPATQFRGAVAQAAAVNGVGHHEEVRTVAAMHGRHDMERMAVRAVTDVLGNTITETVHERLRRSDINTTANGDGEPSTEIEQLKEKNTELNRSNELLKAAAALLAAALERD
jgi:DivIVA domain-containing protein